MKKLCIACAVSFVVQIANAEIYQFTFESDLFAFDFGADSTTQTGYFSYNEDEPAMFFNGTGFSLTGFELAGLSLLPDSGAAWIPEPLFDNSTVEDNLLYRNDQWDIYDQHGDLRFQLTAVPDDSGGFRGDIVENGTAVRALVEFHLVQVQEILVDISVSTINLRSRGRTPVAVITTDDFDATTIDPASVSFAGASPVRHALKDVDGDGDIDLKLHFRTPDLDIDAHGEVTLMGQTADGVLVVGVDVVKL